ncbi:MAG TPA: hypothetical protein VFT43_14035 [Candidatus Polarisedimenticolia bacterium]|nr:hypothetical protein [Candidatus Polarisedimenticolia bacterium]
MRWTARVGTMSHVGTMAFDHSEGGHRMQVAALAEALVSSRRPDGAISLDELQRRLSRAGLEELARAVAFLARRVSTNILDEPEIGPRNWI